MNFVEWNRRMIMVTLSVKFWFVAVIKSDSAKHMSLRTHGFVCAIMLRIRS